MVTWENHKTDWCSCSTASSYKWHSFINNFSSKCLRSQRVKEILREQRKVAHHTSSSPFATHFQNHYPTFSCPSLCSRKLTSTDCITQDPLPLASRWMWLTEDTSRRSEKRGEERRVKVFTLIPISLPVSVLAIAVSTLTAPWPELSLTRSQEQCFLPSLFLLT